MRKRINPRSTVTFTTKVRLIDKMRKDKIMTKFEKEQELRATAAIEAMKAMLSNPSLAGYTSTEPFCIDISKKAVEIAKNLVKELKE